MWRCSGPTSAPSHPWQFSLKWISLWNDEMLHPSAFQHSQFSQRLSCTATGWAWPALSCAVWLTACDALHITPTLAGCTFHKLHCINHYWKRAHTEALRSHLGGSLCDLHKPLQMGIIRNRWNRRLYYNYKVLLLSGRMYCNSEIEHLYWTFTFVCHCWRSGQKSNIYCNLVCKTPWCLWD